jgi:hypothetical protein
MQVNRWAKPILEARAPNGRSPYARRRVAFLLAHLSARWYTIGDDRFGKLDGITLEEMKTQLPAQ